MTTPAALSAVQLAALELSAMYPVEGNALKRQEQRELEDKGYKPWIDAVFPDLFDCEFLPEHRQFWEWGWKFLIALR